MKKAMMTCTLCGHTYSLKSHQGCESCPVQPDCTIICCPSCGFSDVDPSRSKAANWFSSTFFKNNQDLGPSQENEEASPLSIAELPPGMEAVILNLQDVPEGRREQLMAYGLAPGRCVQVLQHNPATIIRVDHTELAIEDNVAKQILVEKQPGLFRPVRGKGRRKKRRHNRRLKFFRRRMNRGNKED